MTRKEAIRFIEQSDLFWNRATEEEQKALNMAIEALEKLIYLESQIGGDDE